MKYTITIPLLDALSAFGAVRHFVGKEPVVNAAAFTPEGDGVSLVATDRYTAARFVLPAVQYEGDPLVVPGELVEFVAKLKPANRDKTGYAVRFEFADTVTVGLYWSDSEAPEASRGVGGYGFNYPPIRRLFDNFTPGEAGSVTLNPLYLAKFIQAAKGLGPGNLLFEHGTGNEPLRVTHDGDDRFTGIIQPARVRL